jgi:hypothetical protein
VVSVALYGLFLAGVLLDTRSTFGHAGDVAALLDLSLAPKTTAIVLVTLLCSAIPFLAARMVRLMYSVSWRATVDNRMRFLFFFIHPIMVFFELWSMTADLTLNRSIRRDVLFTKAFLFYLLMILIALVYLSGPYGTAS